MIISSKIQYLLKLFLLFTSVMIVSLMCNSSTTSLPYNHNYSNNNDRQEIIPITSHFSIDIGHAKIIRFKKAPVRVAVSNPAIVHLLQISPTEWELIGSNAGVTNMYIWHDAHTIMGSEVVVNIGAPAYNYHQNAMELINGNASELIYIGHPSERITGTSRTTMSTLRSDMPEPCLVPGCL